MNVSLKPVKKRGEREEHTSLSFCLTLFYTLFWPKRNTKKFLLFLPEGGIGGSGDASK
jgi:hypothetical protein